MTSLRLPPDPYKILGVEKDATLPQIRLAHRKLVLQCHPDKVQDPTLKAIKVDEFQKVQEAYEILSDVSRRSEYDQSVKLQKLREELGKTSTSTSTSTPTPAATPASSSKTYEYNVRTAEPRPTTYSSSYPKTSQKPPKESNVYSKPPPRSYEDLYDEPARPSVRRSKTTTREPEREEKDRRKHQEEDDREKLRRKMEKEAKRDHGDRKKSREKEKRRGTEEKVRPGTYVEDESSEEEYRRKAAERTARRAEETMRAEIAAARAQQEREARDRERRDWDRERERELRDRERERERDRETPAVKDSPMGDKWKDQMVNAARYVQASRRDSEIKPEVPFAPAPPVMPTMRRAETFAAPSSSPYNLRYETVRPAYENHSEDEAPRRSSAARPSRRSVETPSKSKETPKSSRRSTRESPYVNTASTSPTKPTLHKQYSEPPIVGVGSGRREPSRSKTEYPREPPPPPSFSRAATFTQGMSMKEDIRDRGRGPSRIVREPESETDSGSDSESPSPTPQYPHVRQPRREAPEPGGTTKTYVINGNGRSELKNSSYRSDLRDDAYTKQNRNPSDGRTPTRPPLTRSGGSSSRQARSQSRGYHPTSAPEPSEPIVLTAQPKSREPSRGASRGGYPPQYSVNYAAPITPENIVYSTGTQYVDRRTTDSGHRDYPAYPRREVY